MTLAPILAAPWDVKIHLAAALAALALTPFILFRRKGDGPHRALGRLWVIAMAVTALSSFAITGIRLIGPYSPIHILSIVTLVSLWNAVRAARARRIREHQLSIYGATAGLVGAGGFALFPGRLLSHSLFRGYEWAGFIAVIAATALAVLILIRQSRAAGELDPRREF